MTDLEALRELIELAHAAMEVHPATFDPKDYMPAVEQAEKLLVGVESQTRASTLAMIDEALHEYGFVAPFYVPVGHVRDRLHEAGMETTLIPDAELLFALERATASVDLAEPKGVVTKAIADALIKNPSLWEDPDA